MERRKSECGINSSRSVTHWRNNRSGTFEREISREKSGKNMRSVADFVSFMRCESMPIYGGEIGEREKEREKSQKNSRLLDGRTGE